MRVVVISPFGRAFGAVYASAQLASAIAYSAAGPLVTLTGPRVTFLIAGTGTLAGLVIGIAAWRPRLSGWGGNAASPPQERRW